MGKLVVKLRGKLVADVGLKLGDTVIGRDPACDIVLKDDKAVSKRHALIKTVGSQSGIEDLGSTNGTFLGDRRLKRHRLRGGDIIIIGEHELVYRDEPTLEMPAFGNRPMTRPTLPESTAEKTRVITGFARLQALDGPNQGKSVGLVKEETVIDNPGKSPARIFRTSDGYVLNAQLGPGEPRLNDRPVPEGGQLLAPGDVIEVAGTKYQFVY